MQVTRNQQVKLWVSKGRDVIRRQHLSWSTEKAYLGWWRRFFDFTGTLPPGLSSEQKAERFLTWLAVHDDVSASTQNNAFNAILYFYRHVAGIDLKNVDSLRARRGERIRTAPSVSDTHRILDAMPDIGGYPTNLISRMLYGRGLRLMDALRLRLKDLDFEGRRIYIRSGKGNKDRVVRLDEWMILPLRRQMVVALTVWESDCRNRIPLEIPHLLANKYPETLFSKHWEWLFPQHHPCRHPRTGERCRFHMHPANVQRAFKVARGITGINAIPHEMRHAHATHLLDAGVNLKALQTEMGHVDVRTTLGYCHAEATSVPDPNLIVRNSLISVPVFAPARLEFKN